jgi:ubiquinone biosynthesis protein UbiJ
MYGFRAASALAGELEAAAPQGSLEDLHERIAALRRHLETTEIRYGAASE